jgi:hypothetical protein
LTTTADGFKQFSEIFFPASLVTLLSCLGMDQLLVRRRASFAGATTFFAISAALVSLAVLSFMGQSPRWFMFACVAAGAMFTNCGNYLQAHLIFAGRGWRVHVFTATRLLATCIALASTLVFKDGNQVVLLWLGGLIAPVAVAAPLFLRDVQPAGPAGSEVQVSLRAALDSLKYFFVFSAAGLVLAMERSIAAHLLSGAVLKKYVTCSFALSVFTYAGVGIERQLSANFDSASLARAKRWLLPVLVAYAAGCVVLVLQMYVLHGGPQTAESRASLIANVWVLALGGLHSYFYFAVAPYVFKAAGEDLLARLASIGLTTMCLAGVVMFLATRISDAIGLPGVMLFLYGPLIAGTLMRYRFVVRSLREAAPESAARTAAGLGSADARP